MGLGTKVLRKMEAKEIDEGGKERVQCFSISHPCNWRNNLQCSP